jgi:hypothetical protein
MYNMGIDTSNCRVRPWLVVVTVRAMRVVRYRSSPHQLRHNSNRRHQNIWVNEILDIDERSFASEITIVGYKYTTDDGHCANNSPSSSASCYITKWLCIYIILFYFANMIDWNILLCASNDGFGGLQ